MTTMEWDLLWCCKYCHKDEAHSHRAKINAIIEKVGGRLVCLKKAARLQQRRTNHNKLSVLLTDWREAKPCMENLLLSQAEHPHLTVVYTASDKQFKVASLWASTLQFQGMRQKVHIVPASGDVRELIETVVNLFQSSGLAGVVSTATKPLTQSEIHQQACAARSGSPKLAPEPITLPDRPLTTAWNEIVASLTQPMEDVAECIAQKAYSMQHEPFRPQNVPVGLDLFEGVLTEDSLVSNTHLGGQEFPKKDWMDSPTSDGSWDEPLLHMSTAAFEVCTWPKSIAEVLGPLLPSQDPQDIERMLFNAMPSYYEE